MRRGVGGEKVKGGWEKALLRENVCAGTELRLFMAALLDEVCAHELSPMKVPETGECHTHTHAYKASLTSSVHC